MPQLVIEYTRDVEENHDVKSIMQVAYEAGVASGEMVPEDIKVRARPYDFYRLAHDGDSHVHMTIFLLTGRDDNQKSHIGKIMVEALDNLLADVTTISINFQDMNRAVYQKRILGE